MKIEKNIPMPRPRNPRSIARSYDWPDMQVDDSVFFDNEPKGSQSNPSVAAKCWGANHGAEFSSRSEGNGVRIWRVA
jgi:hypothetical protein